MGYSYYTSRKSVPKHAEGSRRNISKNIFIGTH